MNFSKALEIMKKGGKITRKGIWGEYLYKCELMNIICISNQFAPYRLTNGDLFAEDWEEIKDIPEVKILTKEYVICPHCENEEDVPKKGQIISCGECCHEMKVMGEDTKKTLDEFTEYIKGYYESRNLNLVTYTPIVNTISTIKYANTYSNPLLYRIYRDEDFIADLHCYSYIENPSLTKKHVFRGINGNEIASYSDKYIVKQVKEDTTTKLKTSPLIKEFKVKCTNCTEYTNLDSKRDHIGDEILCHHCGERFIISL
jgi:transcription elongation factor Elf1